MTELRDHHGARLAVLVLSCAMAAFFAPVVDAAFHRVFGAEIATLPQGRGLALTVVIEGREHPVKADAARAESLRVRFAGEDPGANGRTAIEVFAKRSALRDASRVLVVGGVASGETAATGFRRARIVRDRLIAAGWNGDRLVVAGWRGAGPLPVALGQLDRADEIVVVPLVETVRTVAAVEGDPGRALALDSAYSRLAVVSDRPPSTAPAASAPSPAPSVPAPSARPQSSPAERTAERSADPIARIIATAPDMPRPVPKPAAPTASEPIAMPVSMPSAPALPAAVRAPVVVPPALVVAAPRPAVAISAPAGNRAACATPTIVMDDFYPGGPFRDCAGRPRVAAR